MGMAGDDTPGTLEVLTLTLVSILAERSPLAALKQGGHAGSLGTVVHCPEDLGCPAVRACSHAKRIRAVDQAPVDQMRR